LPDDLGVRLNGGRPGAAEGPTAFRAALARYGVAEPDPLELLASNYRSTRQWKRIWKAKPWEHDAKVLPRVFDAGDVVPVKGDDEAALTATHDRVSEASAALVEQGLFPVAIGGGHDLTYAFIRGVSRGLKAIEKERTNKGTGTKRKPLDAPVASCLYFDPHLDVRPTAGSGMSFRRLLDENIIAYACNVGFDPLVNSREHVAWAKSKFISITSCSETRAGPFPGHLFDKVFIDADHIYCSFDIDVLDQSIAPGVSAMNPDGLTVGMAAKALLGITRISSLRCLDFMELCPPHDDRGRTARVAAHLFLIALSGLMQGPLAQERSP
jgi:arginase family enzyme